MFRPERGAAAAGLACLVLGALVQAAPPEVTLRLHHSLPPVSPAHTTMLVPWARKVEADSGGRIHVIVHPALQLGGQAPQLIDQARDGVVDVVWTLTGYTPGRFPRVEVFEMPFLNADPVTMNLAIHDFLGRHPEEFAGYKLVAAFVHAGQALHSRVPVRRADELRGLKIRIPSRMSAWMVEGMGAVPVGAPVSAIPELLSKGVVEGAFIPFEVVKSLRVDELVDYHITLDRPGSDRFNTQVFVIAMNLDRYQRLPADLRAVIDRNSGEATARWLGELWLANEAAGQALAAASGAVIRLPPDEVANLRARVEPVVNRRWFELVRERGLDGPALLAEVRQLIDARRQPP